MQVAPTEKSLELSKKTAAVCYGQNFFWRSTLCGSGCRGIARQFYKQQGCRASVQPLISSFRPLSRNRLVKVRTLRVSIPNAKIANTFNLSKTRKNHFEAHLDIDRDIATGLL